jgi:hypothetical protein
VKIETFVMFAVGVGLGYWGVAHFRKTGKAV